MSKAIRCQKIFIDYRRNGRGSTSVVAYSTRAQSGATVAMPLAWDELTSNIKSNSFTLQKAAQRLSILQEDSWAEKKALRQSLTKAAKTLASVTDG